MTKRACAKGQLKNLLDTSRDRVRHCLEIPDCVLKETTLLVSSTPSQSRTIYNKPIQVPKWCTLEKYPIIISKGISAGRSNQSYRGLVRINPGATDARNYTQCDSLLMGDTCGAHTFPYIEVKNNSAKVEHEATTSGAEDQIFYCQQRGMSEGPGRESHRQWILQRSI